MNARFSFNLFEQPQNPAELQSLIAEDPLLESKFSASCQGANTRPALEMGTLAAPLSDPMSEQPAGIDDVFVPEHYESNYAYPLLVWLQTTRWPAGGFDRIMRLISDRNYFGVALLIGDPDRIEEQLHETVACLRRRFHVHTERVFLAGIGEAGTQAITTALGRPEWFGGIAAISAQWPSTPRLLARFDQLRGKRVLLGMDDRDEQSIVRGVERAQVLLWTAGMHVTTVSCAAGGNHCPSLFRELDRWFKQGIEQPELVC